MKVSIVVLLVNTSLLACILMWAGMARANDELVSELDASGFTEAYVELFMRHEHDSFFRVMQNDSEEPYLSLYTFVTQWLQLEGECLNQICHFYQPKDSQEQLQPYRLDLNLKQCVLPDSKKVQPIDFISLEGKNWLHWASFSACFPVAILWDIESYSIKVKLKYNTYIELEKKLARRRATAKQKAREFKEKNAQKRITPTVTSSASARVKGRADFSSHAKPEYNVRTDAYLVNNNFSVDMSYDTSTPNGLDYYQFELTPFLLGHQFQLGHVVLDSGLANSSERFDNGVYFSRLKPKRKSGHLVVEEQTLPHTFVDVYVNDIYQGTVRSDASGRYSISDFPLSAGEQIELHEMIRPGVIEVKTIQVAEIDEVLLEQGQWDFELGASLTSDIIGRGQFSYGATGSLTLVGTAYKTEVGNTGGVGMRWLPAHFLSVAFEWLPEQAALPLTIEVAMGEKHKIAADINHLDLLGSDPTKRQSQIRYQYINSPVSVNLDAKYNNDELLVIPQIRAQTLPSQFLTLDLKHRRKQSIIRNELNVKYAIHTRQYGSVNFSSIWSKGVSPKYRSGYRFQCSNCVFPSVWKTLKSIYSAQLTWQHSQLGYVGNAKWELSPNWSGELSLNNEGLSFAIESKWGGRLSEVEGGVTKIPLPWEEFIYAELTGKVLDNRDQPLANVELKVNNKTVSTDANGEFHFPSVGYGENLQLHIDDSSLDLNLKPVENPIYFHAEKGGKTQIEVRMNKVFGVDGIVTAPDSFSGWYIHFYHEETSRSFSAKVELDGFYFIEDLIPGDYQIVVEDNDNEVKARAHIRSEDWISGLNFSVYKLHKNADSILQIIYQP